MNMLIWIGYIGDIITIWNITKKWIYHITINYMDHITIWKISCDPNKMVIIFMDTVISLYGKYFVTHMYIYISYLYWWYNSIWVTGSPQKKNWTLPRPAASDPIRRWPRWSSRATSPMPWHGPEQRKNFHPAGFLGRKMLKMLF